MYVAIATELTINDYSYHNSLAFGNLVKFQFLGQFEYFEYNNSFLRSKPSYVLT